MSEGFKRENGGPSYSMCEVDTVSIPFCEMLLLTKLQTNQS